MLKNKEAKRVSVRIPRWVDRRNLGAAVAGTPVNHAALDWVGSYVVCSVAPKQEISLEFPVPTSTERSTINANTDRAQVDNCTFLGSTCVDIGPRDEAATSYPFSQWDAMKADRTPTKTVDRFVAEGVVRDW